MEIGAIMDLKKYLAVKENLDIQIKTSLKKKTAEKLVKFAAENKCSLAKATRTILEEKLDNKK